MNQVSLLYERRKLLLVAVLLLNALLASSAPEDPPSFGKRMKGIVKPITLPRVRLAKGYTVLTGSNLGSYDNRTMHSTFWTCSKDGCKRKPCVLARTNWCKDFFAQTPVPWKSAPRGSKDCPSTRWGMCNRVGNCNYDWAICECPAGWGGEACDKRVQRPCTNGVTEGYIQEGYTPMSHMNASNMDAYPKAPGLRASRCLGYCDADVASCWCPPWTKYGRVPPPPGSPPGTPPVRVGRPLSGDCKPGTLSDGTQVVYGAASVRWEGVYGPHGWCNADSRQDLRMDGGLCNDCGSERSGDMCMGAAEQVCLNQCSGHGRCDRGFCKCAAGWYGVDCSRLKAGLPTGLGQQQGQPVREAGKPWQQLIMGSVPASLDPPPAPTRPRPLIYVYDMPPEFTTRMLQYAGMTDSCFWRSPEGPPEVDLVLEGRNYGTETYLHEMLLLSTHRTLDAEEADFFYVPVYMACYIWPIQGAADFPWYGDVADFQRPYHAAHLLLKAKRWLQQTLPYWNRTQGRDHIWYMPHDEGACYAPTEIYNTSIMLTHWGRLDLQHSSNTAYWADNYTEPIHPETTPRWPKERLHEDWRDLYRGHACYNPEKDLVLPQMKAPELYRYSPLLGTAPLHRDVLFMFRGDVGFARTPNYSRGIRQKLVMLAHTHNWTAQGMVIGDRDAVPYDYSQLLARSVFCGAAPGDGWATRIEDAIQHGCIPVIIQDLVHGPFESILEYDAFSIRLKESAVNEHLPKVLSAISPEQVERMQRRLAAVMTRFTFIHGAVMQDALARQSMHTHAKTALIKRKAPDGHPIQVHTRLSTRNDALSTIMQWLHSRIPHTR